MLKAAAIVSLLLCAACTRSAHWEDKRWSSDLALPEPQVASLSADLTNADLGAQKVELRRQEIAGVPIEGSYVKVLSDKNGHAQWLRAKTLSQAHLPSERVVRLLLRRQPVALKKGAKLDIKLGCEFRGGVKTELRFQSAWRLAFLRDCESFDGKLREIAVDARGRLMSNRPLGASFNGMTEVTPKIYPRGPKASTLAETRVRVSTTPDFLMNPALRVISDAGLTFSSLSELRDADPSEDRFDMVEAYYYASHALQWAEKHLNYHSENLRIRTQVGSPERSNLAFYFDNEVRLGSGDGVTFSHLAWDPSIVIHETMHSVIDALTHLPLGQGEGGSLQEGLADTLTALQLRTPDMGAAAYRPAAFERTLNNGMALGEKNGGLYHDSLILSGTLWQIREQVAPADTAEKLTIFLLARLVPNSGFSDVSAIFKTWLEQPDTQPVAAASRKIMQQRGWL